MTALTQEVLKDMSSTSGSPFGESSLSLSDLFHQSGNIHKRAGDVAQKLQAWLEANNLARGVRIKTVKGKPPEKRPPLGYDWMSTAYDTVLAINLDYHDNAFWLNNPAENKLKRFLRKEGLDLIKVDCIRWYASEIPKLKEAMSPEKLAKTTGTFRVTAKSTRKSGPWTTQWDVYYGDELLGRITRDSTDMRMYFATSYVDNSDFGIHGIRTTDFHNALRWVLLHAMTIVKYEFHDELLKRARIEEGIDPSSDAWKPQFVPFKSEFSGDEGTALSIPFPEQITPEQWNKIYRIIKQKGYDIRSGADAQRAVYGFMQKHKNKIPPVLKDWIDTIALVLDLKAPSQSPDVKTAGATPGRDKVIRRAIREWGTTQNPSLAGYILPSGAMLDLSGGSGQRAYDHRNVDQFFDESFDSMTDAMEAFMDLGPIRWMPEGNGIHIRVLPTARQFSTLRYILGTLDDTIHMDVEDPRYGEAGNEYPARTNPERIIGDIKHFFATGELRPLSQVQQFHLASESELPSRAVDAILSKTPGGVMNKDARAVYKRLPEPGTDGWYHDIEGWSDPSSDNYIDFDASLEPVGTSEDHYVVMASLAFEPGETPKSSVHVYVSRANEGIDYDSPHDVPEDVRQRGMEKWQDYYQKYVYPAIMNRLREHTALAQRIVSVLLEQGEEQLELPLDNSQQGDDLELSPEEIAQWHDELGITKGYEQIDGDYGDPWLYGGTWYSRGVENDPDKWASIVHIEGTEAEEVKEWWSGDRKVQEEAKSPAYRAEVARIKAEKYPDDEDDERAIDEVAEKIAEDWNDKIEITVYRTNADDPNEESWVTDRLSELLRSNGLTHEQWMEMGPEGRVCVVASYHGWHELDHYPIKMNKADLSARLGIEL